MKLPERFMDALSILVLAAIGIGLSLAAFSYARKIDVERVRAQLELRAEWRARDMERKIALGTDDIQAAASFLSVSQPNRESFRDFVASIHDDDAESYTAIAWAPLIRRDERTAFVATVRASGLADYDIRRFGEHGFEVEEDQDLYMPVLFDNTFKDQRGALGLDILGTQGPDRLWRARDTGEPQSTPAVDAPAQGGMEPAYVVLWPVYARGSVLQTVDERRAAFRGMVSGVFRFSQTLPKLIANTPDIVEAITVTFDTGTDARLVGSYDPAVGRFVFTAPAPVIQSGSVTIERTFTVLDRQWTLNFIYSPGTLRAMRSPAPWALLGLGLALTAAIVIYLARGRAQMAKVQHVVEERTADLRRTNLALCVEADERKRIQERLVQAQKMEAIGNLTGGLAHDFNNLLSVIIGNLDLVRPSSPDSENAVLCREAVEAALHGAELTRSLLAYARRQPLQPEQIVPNDLVAGMVRLLGRTLGEDIGISLDLTDDLWPIEVDRAQLEACILNLATNARDAMPSGGSLVIATRNARADDTYLVAHPDVAPGDYAVIEVTDSGCGMPPEIMKQIFEPFFTTKEVGKGTGLGLSMVFGFINQSGGFVTVYSERDVGTTFRLHLPRCSAVGDKNESDTVEVAHQGDGKTILVVEDNQALRRLVVRQLSGLGYHVLETRGAADAIGVIEHERVDLVFSDVVMPGEMDGLGLVRHLLLRKLDVAVLLTSGFPEKKFEDRFKHMPSSVRLLGKPYRKEQLATAVRDALAKKQRRPSGAECVAV